MKKIKPGIGTEYEIFMQQRHHNRAIKEAQTRPIYFQSQYIKELNQMIENQGSGIQTRKDQILKPKIMSSLDNYHSSHSFQKSHSNKRQLKPVTLEKIQNLNFNNQVLKNSQSQRDSVQDDSQYNQINNYFNQQSLKKENVIENDQNQTAIQTDLNFQENFLKQKSLDDQQQSIKIQINSSNQNSQEKLNEKASSQTDIQNKHEHSIENLSQLKILKKILMKSPQINKGLSYEYLFQKKCDMLMSTLVKKQQDQKLLIKANRALYDKLSKIQNNNTNISFLDDAKSVEKKIKILSRKYSKRTINENYGLVERKKKDSNSLNKISSERINQQSSNHLETQDSKVLLENIKDISEMSEQPDLQNTQQLPLIDKNQISIRQNSLEVKKFYDQVINKADSEKVNNFQKHIENKQRLIITQTLQRQSKIKERAKILNQKKDQQILYQNTKTLLINESADEQFENDEKEVQNYNSENESKDQSFLQKVRIEKSEKLIQTIRDNSRSKRSSFQPNSQEVLPCLQIRSLNQRLKRAAEIHRTNVKFHDRLNNTKSSVPRIEELLRIDEKNQILKQKLSGYELVKLKINLNKTSDRPYSPGHYNKSLRIKNQTQLDYRSDNLTNTSENYSYSNIIADKQKNRSLKEEPVQMDSVNLQKNAQNLIADNQDHQKYISDQGSVDKQQNYIIKKVIKKKDDPMVKWEKIKLNEKLKVKGNPSS